MSFESFLENITTFNTIDNVLVCEASFAGLRATPITKKGGSLSVGQEVVSQQFELADAVAEIAEKSRQKGWKGQHVVLVTPAVCMTVLDLAVPPVNKLPVQQLAETMQWEAEPAFNQHQRVVMIGQLLQYFGHLSGSELDEVLQQQAELANAKGNAAVYKVFGELAKDMFGLKQADLANCLSRQKWFVNEGEGLKSGWHAASHQPLKSDALYKWVVAAMNQGVLREWQAAFAKHELALEACYPLVGGGVATKVTTPQHQEPSVAEGKELLLELHQGVMAGVLLEQGEPQQIQTIPCHANSLLTSAGDLSQALDGEAVSTIKLIDSISDSHEAAKRIEDDLNNMFESTLKADQRTTEKVTIAMRNAIYHFLDISQSGFVEAVSAHEPLAPVMQRFEVRALLAVMALMALFFLTELGFMARVAYVEVKKESIAESVNNIRSTIKRIKDETKTVNALQAEIKKKEAGKKQAQMIVQLVSKDLPERNEHLMQLLKSLEDTVTDDVVIEKIAEDTITGFKMQAWSLSEQAAQQFVKFFQIDIHSMGYKVKDLTVTEETGRLGLIGYTVNFTITQLSDDDWLTRKRLGNRPMPTSQYITR